MAHRRSVVFIALAAAVAAGVTGVSLARQNAPANAQQRQAPPRGGPGDMGDALVAGLKSTPGCLGVETAGTASGKQVIFAFFKDKEAAMAWYYHPTHQRIMGAVPGRDPNRKPMANVPDGVPVMAIASISFNGPPAMPESPMPFSSIAIELYTPLNAGLSINEGFAPDTFRALVAPAD